MVKENQSGIPTNPAEDRNTRLLEKVREILEKLGEITDEQIENFAKRVLPEQQESFSQKSEEEKSILTAIDSLTDEEIKSLGNYCVEISYGPRPNKKLNLVGVHDVFGHLQEIQVYTGRKILY